MTLPEMFTVGTIVGSHGVSGHIKIKTRFDAVLLNKGTWCFVGIQKKPVPFFVQDVWDGAGHAVVKLQGIDSPEDVAFYRQKEVLIAKEAHHDLEQVEESLEGPLQWITYELLDQNGHVIGQITNVYDNTSQWLLQVSDSSDEKNLVPFHPDLLIKEDKVGKRIHLHIPEGLLDL